MPKKTEIPQKFSKADNLWVLPKICKSVQSDVGQSVVYDCNNSKLRSFQVSRKRRNNTRSKVWLLDTDNCVACFMHRSCIYILVQKARD